ncbi:MAG: transporter [Gemmatimonadales bacterium]
MKRTASTLWLVLFALSARVSAQPNPHAAQPERPTVATHAGTVAAGWLEFESGLELDHGASPVHDVIGLLVAKVGLASHLQLSLFGNVSRPSDNAGGIGDVAAGLKWRLLDKQALLGDFAVLPSVKIPTGSIGRGSGTGTTDASLLLISSRDAGAVHIDLNAGYTLRDGSGRGAPKSATVWTASFSGAIAGPLQWTAELFGFPGTGGQAGAAPIVGVLAGPTYAVREWLGVDVGGIVPVAGPQPHAFYAGVVWNVGRLWRAVGNE